MSGSCPPWCGGDDSNHFDVPEPVHSATVGRHPHFMDPEYATEPGSRGFVMIVSSADSVSVVVMPDATTANPVSLDPGHAARIATALRITGCPAWLCDGLAKGAEILGTQSAAEGSAPVTDPATPPAT